MSGPDLPEPDQPITVDVWSHRWPTSAEKAELIDGVLLFQGEFDERDVEIASRTYPGRDVVLSAEGLEVRPALR